MLLDRAYGEFILPPKYPLLQPIPSIHRHQSRRLDLQEVNRIRAGHKSSESAFRVFPTARLRDLASGEAI